MDLSIQALIMGLVQGLTEFIPVSSSGHLILVPWVMGWKDPFIDSLAFGVMLHMGTLLALILYFWRDWMTLIPAGLASIRDRSLRDDPDRKMAWLLVVATIPAVLVGPLLSDKIESLVREP
ncbi:MAG TPA: undecaprenyl-diphosphate phosphatase, partial [Candidatus Limnocylindrales bacterium]